MLLATVLAKCAALAPYLRKITNVVAISKRGFLESLVKRWHLGAVTYWYY